MYINSTCILSGGASTLVPCGTCVVYSVQGLQPVLLIKNVVVYVERGKAVSSLTSVVIRYWFSVYMGVLFVGLFRL